jgi:hypothetical protein
LGQSGGDYFISARDKFKLLLKGFYYSDVAPDTALTAAACKAVPRRAANCGNRRNRLEGGTPNLGSAGVPLAFCVRLASFHSPAGTPALPDPARRF